MGWVRQDELTAIKTVLTVITAFALFNLLLFIVCFLWPEITALAGTEGAVFICFVIAVALAMPSIYRFYARRKNAALKKQADRERLKRQVESRVGKRELGMDL